MTISQQILSEKSGKKFVEPGELVFAKPDRILFNDITGPVAINEFLKTKKGLDDPEKVCIVLDHFVPNKDIKSAQNCKECRNFAREYDIPNFFDVGKMGIEHTLLPEKGLICAGDLVIGADSHTCTYGALGAFSTGVGSTDVAFAMATGKLWFKVPDAIKVILKNTPGQYITGKDVILHLIGELGVDGALYKSLEFFSDTDTSPLSMDDRFTICNMAIECGAKNGIFPIDDKTAEYLTGRVKKEIKKLPEYKPGKDKEYDKCIEIDLAKLEPAVAFPHLPENVKTEWETIEIDQVVIGSCTNGRISDLRAAAEVFDKALKNGKKVHESVRCIIIPATNEIYLQALKEGLIETFINAGAVVSTPTCGPCLGGYMGVLAEGERCVSTTNRNFVGRMGHEKSEIYLSSPYVAAASAVLGRLANPWEIMKK